MKRNGSHDADVAVVGGGPAGSAVALELAKRGFSVILIERSDHSDVRVGETIPPGTQSLLERLGIWDRFLAANHARSFGIISAWGQDRLYRNDFIFNPHGAGWHLDRSRFDAMLAACAEGAGARVYRQSRLLSCTNEESDWRVKVECIDRRRSFRVRFLVDASGRMSCVARQQGVRRITYDRLIGVFFLFSPRGRNATCGGPTLIEAAEDGWWYSAVVPDSRLVLVYMTDADLYARDRRQSNPPCLSKLRIARHTEARVKQSALSGDPIIAPANTSRLDRVTDGQTWLAVGDAALAFDPLSGQGIHKGLGSALRAADAIQDYWSGSQSALWDYARSMEHDFERYLMMREKFYAQEQRWPASVFWRRRGEKTRTRLKN